MRHDVIRVTSALIRDVSHNLCDVSPNLCDVSPSTVTSIIITLDGPNYIPWSQAMSSFLKGRKLWRYVTGDIKAPTQGAAETPTEFIVQLEEWDSKNHQIITWIRNTSIPSISLQFGRFDTAHAIWDFLVTRYTTADLACQYQLMTSLCRQRQEPRQSISAFLPQIYSIWDQLTPSEPKWLCAGDSTLFATYRDQQRLILFLMGLSDIYEPVRASLLHRIPLPTLEQPISELLSEETRLGLVSTSYVATALATPGSRGRGSSGGSRSFSASGSPSSGGSASRPNECTFCHATDHRLLTCPIRVCKNYHRRGPGHYRSDCPNNPTRRDTRPQSTAATAGVSSTASASSTLIDISDLPALDQRTGQTLGIGRRHGRLFQLIHLHLPISTAAATSTSSSSPSFGICHSRLGHVSLGRLRFLVSKGVLGPTINEHLEIMSSSTPPYLTDPSIDLFPDDVDVPADPPDDTLHVVPPSIVYPMESSSTDLAPPVLPPAPLPSDIPACRSTRHVVRGTVHLLPVSSADQTADIFTKSLLPGRFDALVTKLKLISESAQKVDHHLIFCANPGQNHELIVRVPKWENANVSKAGSEEDFAQKQKNEAIKMVGVVAGVALIG
ncbi:hypothetical protein Acr_22g0003440 [Actinidia rufa]|uniref:Retrotransposon Copia-like N-terminal domain-containing protein n=1 Tax=Actinidia rufa TaxID=165716 RepID=A0A7J0GJG1_9ERIC|nr:hypothetical protein Acr_22g0003440 [Actinidia rufa]